MSTETDYDSIYARISMIFTPIEIFFGILTNILNLIVLSRRSLLEISPCTHYFLAIALISILSLLIGPGTWFIENYFNVKPYENLFICKCFPYLLTVMAFNTSLLFVFATFDRYCNSSKSARIRRLSSTIIARRILKFMLIIVPLILSPILIIWYVNYEYGGVCLSYTDRISTIITIFNAIVVDCFPPVMMIVFGLLTINNIHLRRRQINPINSNVGQRKRNEIQLLKLLLCQIINYLIFYLPLGIIYTLFVTESIGQTNFTIFMINVSSLWNNLFHTTPFFFYILTSNLYRRELIGKFNIRKIPFRENQLHTNSISMIPIQRNNRIKN